jgi:hypothetical protein
MATRGDGVIDDPRPINGRLWGAWLRAGNDRWDVVRRSWSVSVRNTTELIDLLKVPATKIAFSLQLMNDDQEVMPFWQELDQRLHNQLASAVSLVDHTRRLLDYYATDFPTMVAEYKRRNEGVTEMSEAAFLRDLRNYLVHYGTAPVIQSLALGQINDVGMSGHSLKLSSKSLLEWGGWKARSRDYLSTFADRDGPVLGKDVAAYANVMSELFRWLFEQRPVVNSDANVPDRFRINEP